MWNRVWDRHGEMVTLVVPAVLLALAGLAEALEPHDPDTATGIALGFTGVLVALDLLRRRWPLTVLAASCGLATVQMIAPLWLSDVGGLATAVATYEVAARLDRVAALRASVLSAVALAASGPLSGRPQMAEILIKTPIFIAVAYGLGRATAVRREYARSLEDRAALLEMQRFVEADRAALLERQRLSRDLHDSVIQSLFGIRAHSGAAEQALTPDPGANQMPARREFAIEELKTVSTLASRASDELREIVTQLRAHEEVGRSTLAGSLALLCDELRDLSSAELTLTCEGLPALTAPEVVAEALAITRQAVQNAHVHAHAQRISVVAARDAETLRVTIEDDGCGFDPRLSIAGHFGLQTMTERAELVGGSLTIASRRAHGTRVVLCIPAEPDHPGS